MAPAQQPAALRRCNAFEKTRKVIPAGELPAEYLSPVHRHCQARMWRGLNHALLIKSECCCGEAEDVQAVLSSGEVPAYMFPHHLHPHLFWLASWKSESGWSLDTSEDVDVKNYSGRQLERKRCFVFS